MKAKVYLSEEEIAEIERGTACRNLVRQFFELQKRMGAAGVETDFFDLKILPTTEMVESQPGKYYVVYLKDATKRSRFEFPGGQYVIADFETRFRRALTAFVREILAVIEGGADYEIYARGSSSATPMANKRALVKGREYFQIEFLRKINEQQYTADAPQTHTCEQQYGNDDLPFLRAAFLKDVIKQFYPLKDPFVLESEVSQSAEATAQFAELILFVDW